MFLTRCHEFPFPAARGHLPRGATFAPNRRWPLVAGTTVHVWLTPRCLLRYVSGREQRRRSSGTILRPSKNKVKRASFRWTYTMNFSMVFVSSDGKLHHSTLRSGNWSFHRCECFRSLQYHTVPVIEEHSDVCCHLAFGLRKKSQTDRVSEQLKRGYIEFDVVCIYSAIEVWIHSATLQLLLTLWVSYC